MPRQGMDVLDFIDWRMWIRWWWWWWWWYKFRVGRADEAKLVGFNSGGYVWLLSLILCWQTRICELRCVFHTVWGSWVWWLPLMTNLPILYANSITLKPDKSCWKGNKERRIKRSVIYLFMRLVLLDFWKEFYSVM